MNATPISADPETHPVKGARRQSDAEKLRRPHWSRTVAMDIVALLDAIAIIAGAFLPAAIYISAQAVDLSALTIFRMAIFAAIIAHVLLRNMDMYAEHRLHDLAINPGRLLIALLIAVIAVVGTGLPFGQHDAVHLAIWTFAWLAATSFLLLLNRFCARLILGRLTLLGYYDMRVAVYGAGEIARRVTQYLRDEDRGIILAGIYDDRQEVGRVDDNGLEVSGKLIELISAGRRGDVDQIIVALPPAADRRIAQIVHCLEQLPVSVHVVTHIASDLVDAGPTHKVSRMGPVGLLDVKQKPLADWAPLVKKAEDYVLSAIFLVLALPLFAIIALLIKAESPGPVFFRQKRRGLNSQTIDVLKFRTMNVLENGPVIQQAVKNDPRVTRIGRWLRRTSLDELPQLINVLRGEMSIVGPRPHAIAHDDEWQRLLNEYPRRHQVKPGITGLAQIRGLRGMAMETQAIEARVRNDLEYIANWSLWLDLRIIVLTMWSVLTGHNAH